MADQFTYAKLPADPCLTQEQLLAYIDGKLPVDAQHACEKHMLDCDMCSDAAEGLALVKDRAALAAPVESNGAGLAEKGKVVSLNQPKPNRKMWYSIAAVLVLVLASTFFFQQVAEDHDAANVAENQFASDSIAATANGASAPPPATDCLSRQDQSISNVGPGSPAMAPKTTGPLMAQEDLAKYEGNDGDADDLKFTLESEKALTTKTEAPNDNNLDIALADENVPMGGAVGEELKEEVAVEKTEADKKNSFWEKSKLVVPAATNNQSRSEQQSLSGNDDRVAKEDKDRSKDPGTKSGENKKAENKQPAVEEPVAPETVTLSTVSGNDDYAGGMNDSTVANVPVPLKPAQKNLDLSYTNGVNLMNSGQYNSAIALFDEVLQDSTHVRYEDAEFQKAKTLIKANRKDEAKVLLKAIEAKKGKHAAEATELLKTL